MSGTRSAAATAPGQLASARAASLCSARASAWLLGRTASSAPENTGCSSGPLMWTRPRTAPATGVGTGRTPSDARSIDSSTPSHVARHRPVTPARAVQVAPVALQQHVHVGRGDIVGRVPKVYGGATQRDAAVEMWKLPAGAVGRLHVHTARQSARVHVHWQLQQTLYHGRVHVLRAHRDVQERLRGPSNAKASQRHAQRAPARRNRTSPGRRREPLPHHLLHRRVFAGAGVVAGAAADGGMRCRSAAERRAVVHCDRTAGGSVTGSRSRGRAYLPVTCGRHRSLRSAWSSSRDLNVVLPASGGRGIVARTAGSGHGLTACTADGGRGPGALIALPAGGGRGLTAFTALPVGVGCDLATLTATRSFVRLAVQAVVVAFHTVGGATSSRHAAAVAAATTSA
eukprot:356778-Chlamydomonas_euryale.AAC.1